MFDVFEERFQRLVRSAETPVLGLLGTLLPTEAREAIRQDLSVTPSAYAYAQRLEQYPALFGVWLAEHVMLGLGQDGHFSLYPHLQRAIGVRSELTLPEKERLWRAFRRAMFRLGIQPLSRISGAHYMVDEYVRQAGVPIAFADDLAARMLHLARRLGLPDEDDQEGLLTWQSALLNKLVLPFSVTARKAVERDAIGYYTRAFVRVHLNGGQPAGHDPLDVALAKAFSRDGLTTIKRASIPQLLYRDGTLGILFPPDVSAAAYRVECGTHELTVRVESQDTFRPLPIGLHKEVAVLRADGERILWAKLWPDALTNRLLVFNAEGRLRTSCQLNQSEPVELPPGRYLALCRFEPSNTEVWEVVNESPLIVELPLEVRPGGEHVVANGPASLTILGQNQPSLNLRSSLKVSLEGLEFRYGAVEATVEVPADWLHSGSSGFEVRLLHGDRLASQPALLDAAGKATIELGDTLADLRLPSGLWRVVFELARTGEARTLQRQSVLYWTGLKSISYGLRFAYEQRPQNLVSSSCAGLQAGPAQMEPVDDHSRVLRVAFDVGGGRVVHLSWNRPGVFVEVQVPSGDGSSTAIARPRGAAETVSLTSTKTVVVSASEPGFISLGSMRTFVDFSQRASKAFPASFLASRLEPGARTLTYEPQSGAVSVPLLVLSQPHVATDED